MSETYVAIGEVARASGLTVSALRFYDKEGVFVPAVVDGATGYRRYATAQVRVARLLAGMRRVGVPLAEITVALEQLSDTELVQGILAGHLHRLEDGLADARREIARVDALLAGIPPEGVGWEVAGSDLAQALGAVRFAVGTDPDHPALTGVLLELDGSVCRVVATDRYRLAVSSAPGRVVGSGRPVTSTADLALPHPVGRRTSSVLSPTPGSADQPVPHSAGQRTGSVIAPVAWVDEVARRGATHAVLTVHLSPTELRCRAADGDDVVATPLGHDYPDYRRLLDDRDPGPGVDATALAALLRAADYGGGEGARDTADAEDAGDTKGAGGARGAVGAGRAPRHTDAEGAPLVLISATEDRLTLGPDGHGSVAVAREFLLEALDAAGERPTLALDGPIGPLVIRRDDLTYSLLMPARTA